MAALRWVQQNIAYFGGDPGPVAVFGQSVGGLSVLSHVVSPMAQGFFQGAVTESGVAVVPGFISSSPGVISIGSALNCGKPRPAVPSLASQPPLLCLLNGDNRDSPAIPSHLGNGCLSGLFRGQNSQTCASAEARCILWPITLLPWGPPSMGRTI